MYTLKLITVLEQDNAVSMFDAEERDRGPTEVSAKFLRTTSCHILEDRIINKEDCEKLQTQLH